MYPLSISQKILERFPSCSSLSDAMNNVKMKTGPFYLLINDPSCCILFCLLFHLLRFPPHPFHRFFRCSFFHLHFYILFSIGGTLYVGTYGYIYMCVFIRGGSILCMFCAEGTGAQVTFQYENDVAFHRF